MNDKKKLMADTKQWLEQEKVWDDSVYSTPAVPSPLAGDRAQHNSFSAPSPASLREVPEGWVRGPLIRLRHLLPQGEKENQELKLKPCPSSPLRKIQNLHALFLGI